MVGLPNPSPLFLLKLCVRLLKANRPAEAMAVISALEDKPPSDGNVQRTFHAIKEAVLIEELGPDRYGAAQKSGRASLRELFTGGRGQNFRRVSLGVAIQCFQQVNLPIFYQCWEEI
jgi:hypothetical protein